MNRFEDARQYADEALWFFEHHDQREAQAHLHYTLARISHAQGDLELAMEHITQNRTLMKEIITTTLIDDNRNDLAAANHQYLEFHLKILMDLHRVQPIENYDDVALMFFDENRLNLKHPHFGIEQNGKIASHLLQKDVIAEQLENEQVRQHEVKNERLLDLIFQNGNRQLALLTNPPRRVKSSPPLMADQLRALTDENTRALVYALGEEQSYGWVLGPNGADSIILPLQADSGESGQGAH